MSHDVPLSRACGRPPKRPPLTAVFGVVPTPPFRASLPPHQAAKVYGHLALARTSPRYFVGLLHSFNMPTSSNLYRSLCRRCSVPTSPTLPHTSLRRHCHARIDRIPFVACRTSFTTPSSSKLMVSGELKRFPLSKTNFSEIRELPGLAYFDKTEYISKLQNGTDIQLFCRPRRFGKSLTITMLRCFHGFQFRKQYDKLFKVCGYGMLLGQILHVHITYTN
jgi:hypothetical protein